MRKLLVVVAMVGAFLGGSVAVSAPASADICTTVYYLVGQQTVCVPTNIPRCYWRPGIQCQW